MQFWFMLLVFSFVLSAGEVVGVIRNTIWKLDHNSRMCYDPQFENVSFFTFSLTRASRAIVVEGPQSIVISEDRNLAFVPAAAGPQEKDVKMPQAIRLSVYLGRILCGKRHPLPGSDVRCTSVNRDRPGPAPADRSPRTLVISLTLILFPWKSVPLDFFDCGRYF